MRQLLFFLISAFGILHSSFAAQPNIVVILVDDMGFSDLGCYGSEIPTPNLDALAANGLRFTQFYNTGRCCPTRASLLTGLYPHQAGVGHMTDDKGVPGYAGRLNESCVTIAEVLRPAGYFTAMTGKWHVGQNLGVTPLGRGFDRSLNAAAGGFYFAGGDKAKAKLFLNGEAIENDDPRLPPNWYSTDLWTTFGLKFIDEAVTAKKPFLSAPLSQCPAFSAPSSSGGHREVSREIPDRLGSHSRPPLCQAARTRHHRHEVGQSAASACRAALGQRAEGGKRPL